MNDRTPVLVVSGFLGSGKTTLVRELLADAQARGIRMGVVSNEFGALGIDEALLGGGGQAFVELAGGCVCCQLSDELVETLEALRTRVAPDRIVIETSGVAIPFDAQLNLYRPPVSLWLGDDACVVLVSAVQLHEGEDVGDTFEIQVSNADLLVLHKIDLVPPEALPALEARLEEMNPDAPILRASHGRLPSDLLFPRGPSASRGRPAGTHVHEGFVSEELAVPAGMDEATALAWLGERRGLRTKGFIVTNEGPRVVQGVGRRLEIVAPTAPDGSALAIAPALLGRVVVIRRAPSHSCHTG